MKIIKEKLFNFGIFIGTFLLYLSTTIFFSELLKNAIFSSNMVISNLAQIISELIPLTIFVLIFGKKLVKDFYKFNKDDFNIGLKYWLTGLGIMIISNQIIILLGGTITLNEQAVEKSILTYLPYSIFALCLYAPIVEELIFRHVLGKCFKNAYIFALFSGLIFGGLHVVTEIVNYTSLVNILFIIPYGSVGFFFALAYKKTNNIWSTISVHGIHNIVAIITTLLSGGVI